MSNEMLPITANPGYVVGLLDRALATSASHPDPAVRERARVRAERLRDALAGISNGSIAVGSRTPVAGVPDWATLEVVKGGFATGNLLASGPLEAHELARVDDTADARSLLNAHALSEQGQQELAAMLASGRFRVDVPEEGAMLVLAWLLAHDQGESAAPLVAAIAPFFDRLRFYPAPSDHAVEGGAVARLESVGDVLRRLYAVRRNARVEAMNEMLAVWNPLCDRFVSLFLETVEGGVPTVRRDDRGCEVRDAKGAPEVEGGWPCRRRPARWSELAGELLAEYAALRAKHTLCTKPHVSKENFARLRETMAACVADPTALPPRSVAALRTILATMIAKRGAPGSPEHARLRDRQTSDAARPLHSEIAHALVARLRALDASGGIANIDEAVAPVEVGSSNARVSDVPPSLRAKTERAMEAPLDVLVERGVITSGETLARVSPQITSQVRAAGIADASLRRVYATTYAAVRRRRSLLLLNLERQTRFEDLPWIAALETQRRGGLGEQEQSRQTFEQLATIAFTAFPHVLVPNKLLQEFGSLAKGAQLTLPIVDELAADIFMGTFSGKFLDAAQIAARMLRGTLYERYYGVPFDRVLRLDDRATQPPRVSPGFASLCNELAEPSTGRGSFVASNGRVIEQQQILTTQNLAAVFDALGLATTLHDRLGEMARTCFAFIVRSHAQRIDKWHSRLLRVKNTAYAWRQMIFYLSLADAREVAAFGPWARERLGRAPGDFAARFEPAMSGLETAIAGGSPARRFLGWTEQHWLMPAKTATR